MRNDALGRMGPLHISPAVDFITRMVHTHRCVGLRKNFAYPNDCANDGICAADSTNTAVGMPRIDTE